MKQHVVDIADLGSDRLNLRGACPEGSIDFKQSGVEQTGLVEWNGYVERQGRRIRLAGSLRAALNVACVRCLDPTHMPVGRDFDLFFESRDDLQFEKNAEIELDEPDTRTAFITGTELNIGDVITEQVLLSLPMKPLCREDCKGLCLECGQDLNIESCDCTVPAVNPAFDELVRLKERMTSGGS
jgi:uncharacterized protein